MGKTFNSAQRAARKGKKNQRRKVVAKLHKAENDIMRFGSRNQALAVNARIEKRERLNKQANHTRKAARNEGETQPNYTHYSKGAATGRTLRPQTVSQLRGQNTVYQRGGQS